MMFKIIMEKSHLKNRFKFFLPEINHFNDVPKYFKLEKCDHYHDGKITKTWSKKDIFGLVSSIWVREFQTICKIFECLNK